MIAPTTTRPYRYPERDVEGAVPYGGIGYDLSVFNHPEGIPSCAMAQFLVKPIHAPRQFMPARAIHWPSAAMPPLHWGAEQEATFGKEVRTA